MGQTDRLQDSAIKPFGTEKQTENVKNNYYLSTPFQDHMLHISQLQVVGFISCNPEIQTQSLIFSFEFHKSMYFFSLAYFIYTLFHAVARLYECGFVCCLVAVGIRPHILSTEAYSCL